MNDLSKNFNYDHLIAGLTGGIISTLILHPFDLLKLRFAVNDGVSHSIPSYKGVYNAFTRIIHYEGFFPGLYRGVIPNVIGSGTSWGLYFFIYNMLKASIIQYNGSQLLVKPHETACAAAISGVITLIVTNPIWVVKTRLCLQSNDPSVKLDDRLLSKYKGTWATLNTIYKHEGLHGLYKGFVPGLFGVSHGALQFMAYEELKKKYASYTGNPINQKLDAMEYITLAALSKIFAVNITYPFQVVRARLQDRNNRYTGFRDGVNKIWRYEGARGFYKGLWPQLLRVTPATCITFVVYENMVQYLKGLRDER